MIIELKKLRQVLQFYVTVLECGYSILFLCFCYIYLLMVSSQVTLPAAESPAAG